MPAFSIPLSGLTASSEALSAIANNLANLNTVGYKDTRVLFRDLFYQSLGTSGDGDPIQLGAGTAVSSMPSLFTQGSVNPSGVATDVAIMQDGFFIVQKNGVTSYTRAGNFTQDPKGFLVTHAGEQVMGYPEMRQVNFLEEPALAVLRQECPGLQDFDWARFTFELEGYLDEVRRLVRQLYGTT
jgi:flagellar hook protein FlgE